MRFENPAIHKVFRNFQNFCENKISRPKPQKAVFRGRHTILSRIPDVKIKVAKTQITFANKRGFAFVSFNPCRKAKERPEVWMTVSFGLGYRKESPRINVATEPYPGRWTHHVMVGSPDEIDEELLGWIQEAAEFANVKGSGK